MKSSLTLLLLACGLLLLVSCGGGSASSPTPASTPPPPPLASLAITSAAPPSGKTGSAYGDSGFLLTASGGLAPYQWKWEATSGSSLPRGLSLSPEGLISGTPEMAGTYAVTVTVIDAASPASQVSTNYSITIAGSVTLAITSDAPPNGTVGVEYGPMVTQYFSCVWSPVLGWHMVCTECPSYASCSSIPPCRGISLTRCLRTEQVFLGFMFTAVGGVLPYTWRASGLPPQLEIDPSRGNVTGTPSTAGSYSVMVVVTDSESPPVQASATYVIDITTSSLEAH